MASQAQARRDEEIIVGPQPGFQTRFLSSRADITIGGGAGGAGKSYAELLAPVKWVYLPDFRCTFFRRSMEEIRDQGGLWDESVKLYAPMGATPREHVCEWRWPSGAQISMDHLQYETTVYRKQGSQIALLIFDELTHFTDEQFWYLQSRNRSGCGIKPYTLATCNPDPDSWVAKLIEWWINQETGFAIPERSGLLRYFTRMGGEMIWADTRREVLAQCPGLTPIDVQSLTFIPGTLADNPRMADKDPRYRGKLMAMTRVNRARLLEGNWKIRASAGTYFNRSEVKIIDEPPKDLREIVSRWDLAATEPNEDNKDPDWTCRVKMGRTKGGRYIVLDVKYKRWRSHKVRELVVQTAHQDGKAVKVGIPQDPGQAGVEQAKSYVRDLAGFIVWTDRESGDKETRTDPYASQWQAGNVDLVRGTWNDWYLDLMEAFPTAGVHDDPVDASSGAFGKLKKGASIFDNL